MRFHLGIFLLIAFPTFCYCQENIQISKNYLDSIRHNTSKYKTADTLEFINYYNRLVELFDKKDFIIIDQKSGVYVYTHDGNVLRNFINSDIKENSGPYLRGSVSSPTGLFQTSSPVKNGRHYSISAHRSSVTCAHYLNGQYDGPYIVKNLFGEINIHGQYTHIDSFHIDTLVVYDPDTYEQIQTITEKDKMSVKCGVWKFKKEDGFREEE